MADRMFALYEEGDYEGALAEIDAGMEHLEAGDVPTATFWRICLLSRAGSHDDAIATMATALDQGWWYGETKLRDDDLEPLHGRDDWERLVAESIRRQQTATAPPGLFSPAVGTRRGTVIVLHAANGRASDALKTWRTATSLGYDLYAPASSQLVAHDRGFWKSFDRTLADVKEQTIERATGQPLIMAGRSQGAVRAAQIACSLDNAIGVVLAALAPTPPTCSNLEIPTYILGGQQDRPDFIRAMEAFANHQRSRCVPTRFELLANMGHGYPDDADERIATALAWIESNA